MKKALRFLYGDWGEVARYLAFLVAVTAFIAFLQVLIVYPVQTLATILIGFFVVVVFTLFSEWR